MGLVEQFYKEVEQIENDESITESQKRREINQLYDEANEMGILIKDNF